MKKQYFKVGDKVTCSAYGKGEVVNINNYKDAVLPLTVKYGKWCINYTFDGRFSFDTKRTLHQGHIDIAEPELKEIVTFEKGEYVWVRDYNNASWACRIFSHKDENFYFTFIDQKKEGIITGWKEIRKYEDRPF